VNDCDCPQTKFPGGLSVLHLADTEATVWLGMQGKRYKEEEEEAVSQSYYNVVITRNKIMN